MKHHQKPYIPKTIGELNDRLGWMMLSAPMFEDETGVLPDRNINTIFFVLRESLDNLRGKIGEERYKKMREMSDEMRLLFESDPESKTGGTKAGCEIIYEMMLMLRRKRTTPK